MCVRLHGVYTLSAPWRHESGKQPCEPRPRFHTLSTSRAQRQATETHMARRWKATPVYDAELLLTLIYEDKPFHRTWNYSLNSESKMKEELWLAFCLTGMGPFCSCEWRPFCNVLLDVLVMRWKHQHCYSGETIGKLLPIRALTQENKDDCYTTTHHINSLFTKNICCFFWSTKFCTKLMNISFETCIKPIMY